MSEKLIAVGERAITGCWLSVFWAIGMVLVSVVPEPIGLGIAIPIVASIWWWSDRMIRAIQGWVHEEMRRQGNVFSDNTFKGQGTGTIRVREDENGMG